MMYRKSTVLTNLILILSLTLSFPVFAAPKKGMREVTNAEQNTSKTNYTSFPNMMAALASKRDPYQLYYGVLPEMKEIIDISKNFFTTLIKKNVDKATKPLFAIFPISDKSKNKLKNDIKGMSNKVGPMLEAEYIGYRTIGKLKRYFKLYFISYHPILPIAWELTFYKPAPKGKWQLNYIRFNSDNIYEFIKYPLLKMSSMQKQLGSK